MIRTVEAVTGNGDYTTFMERHARRNDGCDMIVPSTARGTRNPLRDCGLIFRKRAGGMNKNTGKAALIRRVSEWGACPVVEFGDAQSASRRLIAKLHNGAC